MSCEEFQEMAGEVTRHESRAPGKDMAELTASANPDERAGALAHMEECGRCRQVFLAQKELSERLRIMADEMNALQPPSSLEARVLAAFRDRNRASAVQPARQSFGARRRYWALAAAAVLLVFGMFAWQIISSRRLVKPADASNETARTPDADQIPSVSSSDSGSQTLAQGNKRTAPKRPGPRRHVTPAQTAKVARAKQSTAEPAVIPAKSAVEEIATDFVPVGYGSALDLRDGGGQLVRVELPRSALTRFGLPMNMNRADERVKADVLVGPDGVPRAIRFVMPIE